MFISSLTLRSSSVTEGSGSRWADGVQRFRFKRDIVRTPSVMASVKHSCVLIHSTNCIRSPFFPAGIVAFKIPRGNSQTRRLAPPVCHRLLGLHTSYSFGYAALLLARRSRIHGLWAPIFNFSVFHRIYSIRVGLSNDISFLPSSRLSALDFTHLRFSLVVLHVQISESPHNNRDWDLYTLCIVHNASYWINETANLMSSIEQRNLSTTSEQQRHASLSNAGKGLVVNIILRKAWHRFSARRMKPLREQQTNQSETAYSE